MPGLDPFSLAEPATVGRILAPDFDPNDPALAPEPPEAADAARIGRALERRRRYVPWTEAPAADGGALPTVADARARIPAVGEVPGDWWNALVAADGLPSAACLPSGSDCVAIARDLDGDGGTDLLLCNLGADWAAHCLLHTRVAGEWTDVAAVVIPTGDDGGRDVADNLRRGALQAVPRRWPDLEVAGRRVPFDVPESGPEPRPARP